MGQMTVVVHGETCIHALNDFVKKKEVNYLRRTLTTEKVCG